jgi:hypothetical protein
MKKLIALFLFFGLSFAQSIDTANSQKVTISALDSIEENVIGFAVNGRAKSGISSSTLSSEAIVPNGEDVSEYLAFSDFLLSISVRPSNETKATFDLRFHKDWQSAYREGNNSPVIRWWSYDGSILDKKLKFNLGTMRIAYTPLTIYLPEPNLIMEPEIFASLKKEAMEERYLDGTNRRLLQGLNVEFSTPVGVFDNIFLQATLARLRKTANLFDRISYDFDPQKDRYSAAGRIGAETHGVSLSANGVYTFNRFSSSVKNKSTASDSIVDYEKNKVLSFDLGYDSKKLLSGPVNFGAGVEYAISGWEHQQHKLQEKEREKVLMLLGTDVLIPSYTPSSALADAPRGAIVPNYYPYYVYETVAQKEYKLSRLESQNYKSSVLANAFVAFNQSPFDVKLSGHFLNIDKNFESEMASSPAYLPNLPILNSDANLNSALDIFRTGSLENMYYSLYYSLPMNALTIVNGVKGIPSVVFGGEEMYSSGNLYNNYKFSQYYRNAYTQQTYTRLEKKGSAVCSAALDYAVNLALPCGYATPDRTGGDADLSFVWNKAVSVRGVFGKYSAEVADYTRFGGGLEVDIARLASLSKALTVSGSYEQNKEEKGLWNPQVDRVMAGLKVGIWRGLSLSGGFQQLAKEFKNPYFIAQDPETGIIVDVKKTGEVLAIGGPQVKISERAEFSLQGGLLTNSIESSNGVKLDLDKYIMSGTVTVEF